MRVVSEAANGQQAVQQFLRHRPDGGPARASRWRWMRPEDSFEPFICTSLPISIERRSDHPRLRYRLAKRGVPRVNRLDAYFVGDEFAVLVHRMRELISNSRSHTKFAFLSSADLLACPQMCVNPRKSNVSGLPSPRRFRLAAAKRPNSIRRVLSGCSSNPNCCRRSRQSRRNRSASPRNWNPNTLSSAYRTTMTSPTARCFRQCCTQRS